MKKMNKFLCLLAVGAVSTLSSCNLSSIQSIIDQLSSAGLSSLLNSNDIVQPPVSSDVDSKVKSSDEVITSKDGETKSEVTTSKYDDSKSEESSLSSSIDGKEFVPVGEGANIAHALFAAYQQGKVLTPNLGDKIGLDLKGIANLNLMSSDASNPTKLNFNGSGEAHASLVPLDNGTYQFNAFANGGYVLDRDYATWTQNDDGQMVDPVMVHDFSSSNLSAEVEVSDKTYVSYAIKEMNSAHNIPESNKNFYGNSKFASNEYLNFLGIDSLGALNIPGLGLGDETFAKIDVLIDQLFAMKDFFQINVYQSPASGEYMFDFTILPTGFALLSNIDLKPLIESSISSVPAVRIKKAEGSTLNTETNYTAVEGELGMFNSIKLNLLDSGNSFNFSLVTSDDFFPEAFNLNINLMNAELTAEIQTQNEILTMEEGEDKTTSSEADPIVTDDSSSETGPTYETLPLATLQNLNLTLVASLVTGDEVSVTSMSSDLKALCLSADAVNMDAMIYNFFHRDELE